jgi:hypothetical protein
MTTWLHWHNHASDSVCACNFFGKKKVKRVDKTVNRSTVRHIVSMRNMKPMSKELTDLGGENVEGKVNSLMKGMRDLRNRELLILIADETNHLKKGMRDLLSGELLMLIACKEKVMNREQTACDCAVNKTNFAVTKTLIRAMPCF